VHLFELVVICGVGDRREMKNGIEFLIAELLPPIERGEILRDEIAAVSDQVFEIPGAEIINHGQARIRKPLLQGQGKIRADEAGAAGDDEVGRGIGRRHGKVCCAALNKS